jgi:hypothetical protein
MTSFYTDPHFTLYLGDCLEVMRELPAESVDAVVTDPPAGISFMNREWDHHKGGRDAWVAWMTEVMGECYRLLKPGGHILVWALPRTSHWTGWAIESAGFEPRDKIIHCFASGFPKSLDVSKAIDRAAGAERPVLRERNWHDPMDTPFRTHYGGDGPDGQPPVNVTAPATDDAKRWDGWGTSLKPAYEDWWLARKPLRGTVAANVLAYGTGALNIDGTRIPGGSRPLIESKAEPSINAFGDGLNGSRAAGSTDGARWPPNLLLTDPIFDGGIDGVVGGGPVDSGIAVTRNGGGGKWYEQRLGSEILPDSGYGDTGTYSRFFLIPKEARSGREPLVRGTEHLHEFFAPVGGGAGVAAARRNSHPT